MVDQNETEESNRKQALHTLKYYMWKLMAKTEFLIFAPSF